MAIWISVSNTFGESYVQLRKDKEMTEAQKILKLIETVDPADTEKLDEIDDDVFWFLTNITGQTANPMQYTRSRDALKAIRPKGGLPIIIGDVTGSWKTEFIIPDHDDYIDNCYQQFASPLLPTEELAELHAILQAVEYERTTKQYERTKP